MSTPKTVTLVKLDGIHTDESQCNTHYYTLVSVVRAFERAVQNKGIASPEVAFLGNL